MRRPTLAALLCLLAAPALALPWDGTYRLSEGADCARVGEEGGALRIAEGVFEGVGATCAMTAPVDVVDMDATLYTMECEGEGGEWVERAMVMRAAEGDAILVVWDGYAFRYDRCPAAGEAPPEEGPGDAPAAADGEAAAAD